MATITLSTDGTPIEVTTTSHAGDGDVRVEKETITIGGRFFYVDATTAVSFRELPRD